jgi:hypothetical protein
MMALMEPSTFGLHMAGTGGRLPEEWQALLASQASTLAALVSRMQTAVATRRRGQALAAEAKRVLTAQGAGLCGPRWGQRARPTPPPAWHGIDSFCIARY